MDETTPEPFFFLELGVGGVVRVGVVVRVGICGSVCVCQCQGERWNTGLLGQGLRIVGRLGFDCRDLLDREVDVQVARMLLRHRIQRWQLLNTPSSSRPVVGSLWTITRHPTAFYKMLQ